MTIRIISPPAGVASVTVPAPDDPYSTPTTFCAGQVLDVTPGGVWEAAISLANLTPLAGLHQADEQDAASGEGTGN